MLERVDVRKAREDPAGENLVPLFDNRDPGGRVLLSDTAGGDLLGGHGEGRKVGVRPDLEVRAGQRRLPADCNLDGTRLAALRVLPTEPDPGERRRHFRRHDEIVRHLLAPLLAGFGGGGLVRHRPPDVRVGPAALATARGPRDYDENERRDARSHRLAPRRRGSATVRRRGRASTRPSVWPGSRKSRRRRTSSIPFN